MSTISFMQVTEGELTESLNMGKELLTSCLVKNEVITQKQADLINKQYALVVVKHNWFGKILDAVSNPDGKKDAVYIRVVKII